MSLENEKKRQVSHEARRGTWINSEAIALMVNDDDTVPSNEIFHGSNRRQRKSLSASLDNGNMNEIDDAWLNRPNGYNMVENRDRLCSGGRNLVNSVISTDRLSEEDSNMSDIEDDIGELSAHGEDLDPQDEQRLLYAVASLYPAKSLKSSRQDGYRKKNSSGTSESETPSSRRSKRGRNNRRDSMNSLNRSTSTPSLNQLNNIDSSLNSSFIIRKKNHSLVKGLDYGKPRLSQRRSLSPNKTCQGGENSDGRPLNAQMQSIQDNALTLLYDNPNDGELFESSGSSRISQYRRQQRRFTVQDSTSARNLSLRTHNDDDDMDDLMDPKAMRYLPKILRDVYAQREKRRDSLLGDARLASIDLRLRLQRPDHLPHYQDIRGSILILDLSGFTALGERLRSELGPRDGAAEFANRVNSTLSMMVEQVYKYWGDVLMFAGDALICLFEEKDEDDDVRDESTGDLLNCVERRTKERVKDCCLSVLGKLAADQQFSIHGGSAHGMIRCFFLGTLSKNPGSCAFVVSGHPLKQTGNLLNKAGKDEVYVDGEELPITGREGTLFLSRDRINSDDDEVVPAPKNHVSPRDSALLSEAETSADAVGTFGVNAYARAFLGTLAARRLDQGSQNAMSMLLNELRPVAIVFVGLHDLDDIDPRDSFLLQLMNEAFKILSRITHSCNGAVRDMLFDDKGCVFISVFGAHSHEVNPCFDATVSAMRMENALRGLKLKRFSLGVSFGECFCGEVGPEVRSDYVVMGPEVNMAARLMSKAPNLGTLVSKRIFSRSNDFIEFEESKQIQVKGKDGFFHAYIPLKRIDRQRVEIAATQQPFVLMPSRQTAMNSLVSVKDKAAEGEPSLAFVYGGPFLGKSRLIDEVAVKAVADGFTLLKSFRTSLDSFTSFFPLRQIVAAAMKKVASTLRGENFDDEVAAANYLVEENILKKTDRVNIGSIVPQVADAQLRSLLSGMNPNARTKSIVDSMMKILKLLNPLLIVLEGDGDIDPSSWSLLAEIMQRAKAECPTIMIIVSSRDSPTITSAASNNLIRNAVQVKLVPFEKSETREYLCRFFQVDEEEYDIDERLIDVVHSRANGCPLFIESVARWANEKKLIEIVESSKKMTLKMDERSDDVTDIIPRELSNILLAPFNHLSPPLWDALKIASCIGYSFDSDLYRALNQELGLIPKIEELSEKYGCFEHTGTQFRWKQQAVYEAVKSLLLVNQRQIIHRMIVDAFRANDDDLNENDLKTGDVHRLLGRHCALAEDWAAAFEQYIKAGDHAKDNFNFNEASKMYEEALDYQAKMTEPLTLRSRMIPTINLGACFRELARYREAEAVLTRCLDDTETNSTVITLDDELYVRALTALAALHQARSNYDDAKTLYEKAVPIARIIQESRSSLWLAGNIAGYAETLRKSGDLPQAELHHREALEIRIRAVEEKSCTELELAVSYTQLGCTLAGMRRHNEAYEQHHRALGLRYRYLEFSHGLVSESMNYCAESLCALGRGVDGIPLALHAVEIRKNIFGTSHPAYAHALSILASCYHSIGRSFDARDCLEKCLEICEIAFQQNHANLIPNLMNYGNVLRSTGDLKKACSVYERAIAIHQLNFKEGQQASRLEKCRIEVANLTQDILQFDTSRGQPCDSVKKLSDSLMQVQVGSLSHDDVESSGPPVIVFTDIGRDVDDEMALVLLSALRRKHLLNPIAVITTLYPSDERARLARGSLDVLGMADVPVGIGSAGGADEEDDALEVYEADYSISSPFIHKSGIDLVHAALKSAPPNSVQLLCIASLTDVATVMREQEQLFTTKVKEVLVMGGVVSPEIGDTLVPDSAYNNNCDLSAARYVYRKCQEIGIPTLTLSRWAAYGCPMPPQLFDEIALTEHMVATNIRSKSKKSIDRLWNKVRLHPSDFRREKLPNRCDANWFCRTFMSKGGLSKDWNASVWSLVQKINMYDPLALLLAVPAYRTAHFSFKEKVVNGIRHLCVGTSERETGIKNRLALFDEYSSLFLYAFKESLQRKVKQ